MISRIALASMFATAATSFFASSALAQEASAPAAGAASKMRAQAQIEMLPIGSGKASIGGDSTTTDAELAYGISAAFDYAVTPFLSIGVAPRLILNVAPDVDDGGDGDADKEVDLRARILAHFPVAPKLEAYAYVSPGYSIVLPADSDADSSTGFGIGGAAGVTYDVSPSLFVNGELGYQRAFTSTEVMLGADKIDVDLDLSYFHVGVGAGTRF
jgi:opacity protein-like surface antigen